MKFHSASAVALLIASNALPAGAQGADPRPTRWGYGFARAYDAEIAAPDVHRLRYEDEHIQFLEVSNPPGYHMQMHGHPYPSVFARDSGGAGPGGKPGGGPVEQFLDPKNARNGQGWHVGTPPAGESFPSCTSADPQAPHLPANHGDSPLHFYRIEFKHADEMEPARLAAYSHAPLEQIRYETASVRLVEVTVQPGQTAPRKASTPAAVLAFDTVAAFNAVTASVGAKAGRSLPPAGMPVPRCITTSAGPQAALANSGRVPLHYYRIEFKRVDGTGLHDHWREWYPFMVDMH